MARMIEPVDANPFERAASPPAFPHGLQHWAVRPKLRVAVHAGLGRWNPGKGGLLHGGMAVAAVDPGVRHVVLVAEGHGLDAGDTDLCYIRRAGKVVNAHADRGH